MIENEQIELNKIRFIGLIKSITREFDKEGFITRLINSDFFIAPASTKYHASFTGGLCYHSLNVYDNLVKLMKQQYGDNCPYSDDTIKIVSLLHDLSKINFYEVAERNVKNDKGSWVKEPFIKVKEDRFFYGNHEQTSSYLIQLHIPLTLEEDIAVLHHHAGMSDDCAKDNISAIFNQRPLALLLHLADMLATYFDERVQ